MRGLQRIFFHVVKALTIIEILLLRFDVDRQRNRAEAIVAIRDFGRFAKFRGLVGLPLSICVAL